MDKLTNIFQEIFEDDSISVVHDLEIRTLENWDSFNHINLMIAVENTYSVVIMPEEMESIHIVGDLLSILSKKGCTIDGVAGSE